MSSPFWKYPSVLNGRIGPVWAEPQGVVSVIYYGGSYFYAYGYSAYAYSYESGYSFDYSTQEDNVFLLGEDSGHYPSYRFVNTDVSYVEQTIADLTDIDVVYFTWRLNTSEDMPNSLRTLSSGSIQVKDGGIGAYGDGMLGIVLPSTFTTGFLQSHVDRHLTLVGTANDGTYRIAGVPWNTHLVGASGMGRVTASPVAVDGATQLEPGDADPAPGAVVTNLYKNGQVCILDTASVTAETVVAPTVTIPGVRWVAKAYVNDILRTELRETRAGRSWQRNYMAAHVAQLTGVNTLKFELSLEDITV